MIQLDVDTALAEVPVNVMPLLDDTDFKTRETAIAYNAAGMDLVWNFVTSAGAYTQTAVTPTTAGDYDWTHQGDGMYTIEIPASGGASINNDTEGYGWFSGVVTGVLPFRSPTFGFRAAALNDALCDGGDNLDVNVVELGGATQSATDLKDFADAGYDPATNKVEGVKLVDTTTTNTDMRGTDSALLASSNGSGLTEAGGTGDHLTGVPWNAAWDAEVESEATDALNAYDPPTKTELDAALAAIGVASGTGLNYEAEDDNVGGAIKSITFVGVETSGTFASTEAEDGTYHQIDDTTNAIDIVYQFDVGGIRRAIQAIWHGYVSGSNDVITVQAYDYVGADWETRATITGQAGTDNIQKNISLLQKHTGSGADAGKVLLRFVCSGQSNPTLYTDGLLVEAAIASQSVGYANGAVWLDTNASNTNTTDFVDGTADNPVSTWAAAETVANSLGLTRFEIAPGSSITLDANSDNFQINAPGSTIALGGQSVSGTVIKGASVTGNDDGSNANPTAYFDCTMGSNTLGLHRLKQCGLSGTITLAESGTYDWTFCSSEVAGTGTPACDVGTAVGSTNLNIRNYSGGIEIQQLGDLGTDNVSLEGNGQLVINANCSGGTVAVRGNFRITDNSGTVNLVTTIPTINQVDNGTAQSATANSITLAATASSTDGQYDPGTVVIIAGTGEGQSRDIIDYDGTTKVATVSKDWRTNPDSTSSYVVITTSGQLHVNEGMAQGGGASTITLNTAASSTDDIYIGQTVFLVGGTGQDQSRIVTDYDGTSKVATVHKAWNTQPTSSTSYVMLPLPAIGDSIVNIETDTNELQTNQGNWLTATGFAVAGDQMTLENDAITAAKIAADAIGASELAADAVTEIQSGLSTYDGSDTSGTTTLLSRLTATRAGYLDNLSEGAVATASKLLKYVQLLFRKDAAIATDNATELTAINADGGSGAGSVDNTTDSQQGIADASGSTPPTVEQIRTEMDDNSTKLAAIVADTNELQTNQGQWLTATGFSTLDAAGVRTAIGLAAANLDTQLGKADLTAALTEAYRSTGATGSAAQLLYEILAHLGEFAITSTTKTTKKLDGSTTAKTYTLDSDTNPTSITEST